MDFQDLSAVSDLPYPEPIIPYSNPIEAKKLMNDYGGRDSEPTAIMQYIYQSYILKRDYPEYAAKLEEIAISEMHHHELLGTSIAAYGSFPVIGGRNTFWNGSFVNYVTDLVRLLEADIQGEELAIANYEKTILCLQNDSVKQMIERIIVDEEIHVAILKSMLACAKAERRN